MLKFYQYLDQCTDICAHPAQRSPEVGTTFRDNFFINLVKVGKEMPNFSGLMLFTIVTYNQAVFNIVLKLTVRENAHH